MTAGRARTRATTLTLAAVAVVLNVAGNVMLRRGMSSQGPVLSLSPLDFLGPLANPWVIGGVAVLACWLVAQLSLFSWADLSYALPVTSASYVLITLMGAVALGEHVSLLHWLAVGLIVLGVALVGETDPRTGPPGPGERP